MGKHGEKARKKAEGLAATLARREREGKPAWKSCGYYWECEHCHKTCNTIKECGEHDATYHQFSS